MKKLFLGALALMLVVGNKVVAISVADLEPKSYIMVLAEDSSTPVMIYRDIIKESTFSLI